MEQRNLETPPTKMVLEIDNWKNLSYDQKLKCRTPVDCSFIVGEGANAKTMGAHKSILICASEVFHNMFKNNYTYADASFNIPLPNVVYYVDFKVMLEYIYYTKTDSIQLLNLERLKHVAYLANYYLLDPLLKACHLAIEKIVLEKNISFYEFLQVFEYEKKIGRRIDIFKANDKTYVYADIKNKFPYMPEVLMTNTSIYDLGSSCFYDLLIILASTFKESVRFGLIENYAKIHGLKMDKLLFENIEHDDSEINSEPSTNGKSLKEMLELIDFKKMTTSEFIDGPAVSKVWTLSHEEKLVSILRTNNVENNENPVDFVKKGPAFKFSAEAPGDSVKNQPLYKFSAAAKQFGKNNGQGK